MVRLAKQTIAWSHLRTRSSLPASPVARFYQTNTMLARSSLLTQRSLAPYRMQYRLFSGGGGSGYKDGHHSVFQGYKFNSIGTMIMTCVGLGLVVVFGNMSREQSKGGYWKKKDSKH